MMTENTVPYRAAIKLFVEASEGLSDWDAGTLEMMIDHLYERFGDRGVYMGQIEDQFDHFFICYHRALENGGAWNGWVINGRAVNAADEAQSEANIKSANDAAWTAWLADEQADRDAEQAALDDALSEVADEVDAIIEEGNDWQECDDYDSLFPAAPQVEVEVDERKDDFVLGTGWFVPAPAPRPRSLFARAVEAAFVVELTIATLLTIDLYVTHGVLPF